jgi:transcriptional regulator
MYQPAHFVESRAEALHDFIARQPLGLLVTVGADGPAADPVPFLLQPEPAPWGTLIGHVARANPLWRTARDTEVLVVFQGAQGYVSPGWYPAKAAHGKVVPTWNYATVQGRGPLRVVDDADAVHRVVAALTQRHEAGQRTPWALDDAPPDYRGQMLKAIVAIEIPLRTLVGKFKLSQNRDRADRLGVEAGLRDGASPAQAALADAMQALREQGA